MVKKNISIDEDKLSKFELYCKKSGRAFSPLCVLALEQYILRNPPK